jgi:general secretion pathway protein G
LIWLRRFHGFHRLDNVYRIVTVPLQLVALILMLLTFFGDPLPDSGHVRQVAARGQINAFLTALKTYKADTSEFPTSGQGLQALVQNSGVVRWHGPYVDKQISTDLWGHDYIYHYRPGQEPEIVTLASDGPWTGQHFEPHASRSGSPIPSERVSPARRVPSFDAHVFRTLLSPTPPAKARRIVRTSSHVVLFAPSKTFRVCLAMP